VSNHVTAIGRTAGEIGATAHQVLSAADQLATESGTMKSNLERFLAGVRTSETPS
jgi:hypothetical protein